MLYTYDDVLRFIEAHKFLKGFHDGDAYFLHKWFFNEFNSIRVNVPKYDSINDIAKDYQCKVIKIHNFKSNIILTTEGISEKYKHYTNLYLQIEKHYMGINDIMGISLIRKILNTYYSYISGHLWSHNDLVENHFNATINTILIDLASINSNIRLEDYNVVLYDCNPNDEKRVAKFLLSKHWIQSKLEICRYMETNYDDIKTKTTRNN